MTQPTVTQEALAAAARYWGNDNPPLELQAAFQAAIDAAEQRVRDDHAAALRARGEG